MLIDISSSASRVVSSHQSSLNIDNLIKIARRRLLAATNNRDRAVRALALACLELHKKAQMGECSDV